ncbi:MAG: hypothetical protein CL878_04590 [Dehalococcoidia bacterium]|nr:hypothetical protein [Dehalococcoidia bacterium]
MLGQRPADAYRAYQSRSSRSRQPTPPRKRRGRVAEVAIIAIMVVAGLFVILVGFWAFTLGGQETEPEVRPTPTLGERPRGALRVIVQGEAGNPLADALVEFRDRLDQIVASERTDQGGQADAFVPVGADYSVAVRIPGYEVARVLDVVVTEQASPRHEVTLKQALGARSFPQKAAPPAATVGASVNNAQVVPAPARSASGSVVASAAPATNRGAPAATAVSTTTSTEANTATNLQAPAPQLIVAHPDARFTTIDPASNLALRTSEPLGWRQFPLLESADSPGMIWVGPRGSNRLIALDLVEMAVANEIKLDEGVAITGLAVQPSGDSIWVGGVQADAQVSGRVVEVSTAADSFGAILRQINVPAAVSELAARADGGMLYLLHRGIGQLSFLRPHDGQTVLNARIRDDRLSEPTGPTQQTFRRFIRSNFAVATDQSELYFVNPTRERILAISAASGEPTRTIEVGEGIAAIQMHPDGIHLYVANRTLGMVQLVDLETAQVADAIPVGQIPRALTFSPDGTRAYVANQGSATVSVIDVAERRVSDTIAMNYDPLDLIYAS